MTWDRTKPMAFLPLSWDDWLYLSKTDLGAIDERLTPEEKAKRKEIFDKFDEREPEK